MVPLPGKYPASSNLELHHLLAPCKLSLMDTTLMQPLLWKNYKASFSICYAFFYSPHYDITTLHYDITTPHYNITTPHYDITTPHYDITPCLPVLYSSEALPRENYWLVSQSASPLLNNALPKEMPVCDILLARLLIS